MNNLIQLVEKLNKSEVRLIRSLLEVQSLNQKSHRLELFNLIHSKKVKTNFEAALEIYHKKPNAVYYNLKSRLKNDIINISYFKLAIYTSYTILLKATIQY